MLFLGFFGIKMESRFGQSLYIIKDKIISKAYFASFGLTFSYSVSLEPATMFLKILLKPPFIFDIALSVTKIDYFPISLIFINPFHSLI